MMTLDNLKKQLMKWKSAKLAVLLALTIHVSSVAQITTFYKVPKVSYYYTNLTTPVTQILYLKTNSPTGNLSTCTSPTPNLRKATMNVLLNWNNDYIPTATETHSVTFNITAYNAFTGTSVIVASYNPQLVISKDKPQAYVSIDFTGLHPSIARFDVNPVYSCSTTPVNNKIAADVYYTEEFDYDVTVMGQIPVNPITVTGDNLVKFSWRDVNCIPAPNYQFQLLRLYNTRYVTALDERNITTAIDWSKALTVETGSSLQELSLTIAEGEGYYAWRVRPIGNTYEGGIANSRNWGQWSNSLTQNTTPSISTGTSPYLFYFSYNMYDFYNPATNGPGYTATPTHDGTRNWIFSRAFMEGDALSLGQVNMGESISYANKLQMKKQSQGRIMSENKTILSQTIYDYSGRAALNMMATPINRKTLGYVPAYIKNNSGLPYSAVDFDYSLNFVPSGYALNYRTPSPVDSVLSVNGLNSPSNYYSSINPIEDNVPTAAGYPYSRTLFSKDGTNTPLETSMPGKDHQINNTTVKHTTRAMHSGVADIELIRVFGDEAPDENSAYKTISIDANNTASVNYISKEGKTIATCLSSPSTSALLPINSASVAGFPVVSNINSNNSSYGPYAYRSFKTLALTEQTNVTLNYSLTTNTYSVCANFCATCDYKITLKVSDNSGETAPLTFTSIVQPTLPFSSNCSAVSVSTNTTILLPAGAYTIERIIETNTSPGSSYSSYINTFIQAVQSAEYTSLTSGTGTILGGGSINMASLFQSIKNNDLTNVYALLGVTSTDTYKLIKIGCDTLRVPIWPCTSHSCTDYDFEGYLYSQYGYTGATPVATKEALLQNMFNNLGYTYSYGDFNTVIQNMQCTSDCSKMSKMWDCWIGVVGLYKSQNNPNNIQPAVVATLPGGGSATLAGTNYLERFLSCVGYTITQISASAGTGVCNGGTEGYKTHPFKYIKYAGQCCSCESAFYQQTGTAVASIPTCPIAAATFTNYFNTVVATGTLTAANMSDSRKNYYLCFNNNYYSSPGNCNLVSASATGTFAASSATLGTSQCNEYCEGLYTEFVSKVNNLYHSNNMQIQGDVWTLQNIAPTGSVAVYVPGTTPYTADPGRDIPLSTIYCQANNLVNTCKSKCTLTPQLNGVGTTTALGSPAEIAAIQQIYTGQFVISLPVNGSCGSLASVSSGSFSLLSSLTRALNQKLNLVRATSPIGGMWWDYKTFVSQAFSPTISALFGNTYVFVHPDIPSFFDTNASYVVYNFNKNQSPTSIILPKYIASINAVGATPNFTYTSVTTAPTSAIVSPSVYPTYLFTSGTSTFVPYTNAYTGFNFMPVTEALLDAQNCALTNPVTTPVFNIDGTTVLTSYNHAATTFTNTYGYWQYNVSIDVPSGSNTCPALCYTIQPFSTQAPPGELINDLSPLSCEAKTLKQLSDALNAQVSTLLTGYYTRLTNQYKQKCYTSLVDVFTASYVLKYHHYTLYYYDRAGNLVKTVSPAGVTTTAANRLTHPVHTFITEYAYNSLTQLVRQYTPDGGETNFWYDAKGKLRFSQNAKQLSSNLFSYTKYDALTRIIEVGEFISTIPIITANINTVTYPTVGNETQKTKTVYSTPAAGISYFGGKLQRYLQNRVSYSLTDKDGNLATTGDQVATYYSYDPHGNVEWLIQDIPELGRNYIAYEYDLISGSVVKVRYNEAFSDQFFHRYSYDIDKRLKSAETSTDGIYWEKDATYNYYLHGPLKRTQIGQDAVQGLDYAYTIHGWLKAMNGIGSSVDPGGDGGFTDMNMYVAKDAYSMILSYYKNDYFNKSSALSSSSPLNINNTYELFNGNISGWTQSFDPKILPATGFQFNTAQTARLFRYDELNRLITADSYTNGVSPVWNAVGDYSEKFSYDANGNILTLERNGNSTSGLPMDKLDYSYYSQTATAYVPNKMAPPPIANPTNRLAQVTDVYNTAGYSDDIETQAANNFSYDAIGNLTASVADGLSLIKWNVYGKLDQIQKTNGTVIDFLYDASGNRVLKRVSTAPVATLANQTTTYYVKDASGNSMGVYERTNTGTSPNFTANFTLKEEPIYGSERIGLRNKAIVRPVNFTAGTPPAPQNLPTLVHTGSYRNIMLPLSNNISKQVYMRNINSSSESATAVLGTSEHVETVPSEATAVTYNMGRAQAILHDQFGNPVLSMYAYSSSAGVNTTVVYLRDTIKIPVPPDLNCNPNTQAMLMQKTGSTDEYYLFTIGNDNKPYYHTIDVTAAAVTNYNTVLDDTNADYGQTMALFEDLTGQGSSTLYLRRFNSSTNTAILSPYSITTAGISLVSHTTLGSAINSSVAGEMVISPSGTLLAIANNSTSVASEIKIYTLGVDHQPLTSLGSRTFGGIGKSVEFTNNDISLYYTSASSTGVATVSLLRVPVASFVADKAVTIHTQTSTAISGSVRRGANGNMYYLTNTTTDTRNATLNMFTNPDATVANGRVILPGVIINGSLHPHPHQWWYINLSAFAPATVYNRQLDNKTYEIKDHLGNIHATIKDYKVRFGTVATTDVIYEENFNDGGTGGFVVNPSPGGTIIQNTIYNPNVMQVYTSAANGLISKAIPLGSSAGGQYILSFDYQAGSATFATYNVPMGLTSNMGDMYGAMAFNGRNDEVISVPPGVSTITLYFSNPNSTPGQSFYIDNILLKKLDPPSTVSSGVVINENFSTPSNWIGNNVTVSYASSTLKLASTPTSNTGWNVATKTVNLLADQMYKVSFSIPASSIGSNVMSFAYDNDEASPWLDYSAQFTTPTAATGSYTFYIIPKTNNGTFFFQVGGSNYTFNVDIDDFKVENVIGGVKPLYQAVLNTATDYYAFGSPMPGRSFNSGNYKYGFNKQLKDDDILNIPGSLNSAEYWEYDTRLGRRWNIDPVTDVSNGSYTCFSDNPILLSDHHGDTPGEPVSGKTNATSIPKGQIGSSSSSSDEPSSLLKPSRSITPQDRTVVAGGIKPININKGISSAPINNIVSGPVYDNDAPEVWVGGSPDLLSAGRSNTQNMPHAVNFKEPGSNAGMEFPGAQFGASYGPVSLNSEGELGLTKTFGPIGVGTGGVDYNGYTAGSSKEVKAPTSYYVASGSSLIKRVDVVDVITTTNAGVASSTNYQRFKNENFANGTSTNYKKVKDSTQMNGNYNFSNGVFGGSISVPIIYKNNMPVNKSSFLIKN